MAMTGENKEITMQTSLNYHSLPILDHNDNQLNIQQQNPPSSNSAGGSKSKPPPTKYRECLKNHAASIGGNITDGCGEFMPCGEDGTLEALKCAACNCHRNFHRKIGTSDALVVHPFSLPPPLPSPISVNQQRAIHSNHWTPIVQPVKMAFGFGGGASVATDSSSEELNFNVFQSNAVPPPPQPPFMVTKKRFRTKFTKEQKDKMMEFAEQVGWRIPREDDPEVQRFCGEVGVKRQVLKVWMHNNKSSGKKQIEEPFESNAVRADGLE